MLHSGRFGSKTKSKNSPGARPLFLCQPYCNKSIVKGNFKTIVQLPKYVDLNEWLAVNGKITTLCVCCAHSMVQRKYNSVLFFSTQWTRNPCPSSPTSTPLEQYWTTGTVGSTGAVGSTGSTGSTGMQRSVEQLNYVYHGPRRDRHAFHSSEEGRTTLIWRPLLCRLRALWGYN